MKETEDKINSRIRSMPCFLFARSFFYGEFIAGLTECVSAVPFGTQLPSLLPVAVTLAISSGASALVRVPALDDLMNTFSSAS